MARPHALPSGVVAGLVGALTVLSGGNATAADPNVAPGGNFDLSVWQLQESVGSPASIPSSRLQGANGYQDSYFYTDTRDGAMTFWAPRKGSPPRTRSTRPPNCGR